MYVCKHEQYDFQYDFHIFTVVYSPLHRFIWYQHHAQLPVALLAQLVERCTGVAEVMVQIQYRPKFFFRPYFHYCSSGVHYCKDCFHIHKTNKIKNC